MSFPTSIISESVVSPSDSASVTCKALWIGTAGDVAIKRGTGATVTYYSVPVGFLPVDLNGDKVMAATTAGNILACVW